MTFNELLGDCGRRFRHHGVFELRKGEHIRARARAEGVPDEPGVYLIYGCRDGRCELLQIGKAGTLRQDGSFKYQKLLGRLGARQNGMTRQEFYQQEMERSHLETLLFKWFVTFDPDLRIIPAKAESDLLQGYFDEHGHLPEWKQAL